LEGGGDRRFGRLRSAPPPEAPGSQVSGTFTDEMLHRHIEHPVAGVLDAPVSSAEFEMACGLGRQAAQLHAEKGRLVQMLDQGHLVLINPCL